MSRTLADWIKEITEWQDSIFTQATPLSAVKHLQREVRELFRDLCYGKPVGGSYSENVASEIADCFLLIISVAHLAGVDLETAVKEKMSINRMREWGKPDAQGVVEHVRNEIEADNLAGKLSWDGEQMRWKGKTLLEVFEEAGIIDDDSENILLKISKEETNGTLSID